MPSTDREIDWETEQRIHRQEQQKLEELGSYLTEQIGDKTELPTVKLAKQIRRHLNCSEGASLCFAFWLSDLQEICIASKDSHPRLIQLGRMIKLTGGARAVNYALWQTPQCSRELLKQIWHEFIEEGEFYLPFPWKNLTPI